MIEEVCKRLKEKRQELDLDLEDIVEKTKLHPSVIKAIENYDVKQINPIYLKGFIKIYASFLGVRVENDALEEISSSGANRSRINKAKVKAKNNLPDFGKLFSPQVKKVILSAASVIVIIVLIGVVLFNAVKFLKNKIQIIRRNKAVAVSENKESLSQAILDENRKLDDITVSFSVKRDCFIKVKRDYKIVFEGVLRKGALESWQAKKELEFRLSDGSSVDIEVNGKLLPPLSKIRKPIKSLKITPQGISIDK